MGHFGLTWLHKVTMDPAEHSADLEPLPPVKVVIRGKDVTEAGF
jgi:hypothetical protein